MGIHKHVRTKVSAYEFVRALTAKAPKGAKAWIAHFTERPSEAGAQWNGRSYTPGRPIQVTPDENAYYSIAVFRKEAIVRERGQEVGVAVVVCDDIGEKVKASDLREALGKPSFRIKTSRQSEQWGYFLDSLASADEIDALHKALIRRELTDPNGMNAVRYARFPFGINNKTDPPFKVHAEEWHPGRRVSLAGLSKRLDGSVTLDSQGDDIGDWVRQIVTGKNLHDPLNRVAGHLIATGITATNAEKWLQGLMNAIPNQDRRWRERFNDLKRTVRTAAQKFGRSTPADGELVVVRASDVVAQPVESLWPDRFFMGKINLIAGLPGVGKTTLAMDIMARTTVGAEWPDDSGRAPLGDVLLLTTEDDLADTVRPRLEAMGADLSRVHLVRGVAEKDARTGRSHERLFSLARHVDLLDRTLRDLGDRVRVVVFDPITGYFGGTDTHKTADVREVFAMLSPIASERRMAVIGISHPNKSIAASADFRITGSMAFTAAPRAVWIAGPDPQNPDRAVIARLKGNLAADPGTLAYKAPHS